MLVGRGNLDQPLSEEDMLRERVSNNVGEASDEQVSRLALTEHVVVTIPANTSIYVVLEKTASSGTASGRTTLGSSRSTVQRARINSVNCCSCSGNYSKRRRSTRRNSSNWSSPLLADFPEARLIGIGAAVTPATPPCVRVRTRRFELVALGFIDQRRKTERFEVGVRKPHGEGFGPGEVPGTASTAGRVRGEAGTNP